MPSAPHKAITERHLFDTLELMAALSNPLNRTRLLEWLKHTDRRLTPSRAYSSHDVRAMVSALLSRDAIRSVDEDHTFVVADSQRHAVLAQAHREQRLAPLVETIRRVEPLNGKYGWSLEPDALVREFAWSLHLGLSDEARDAFARFRARTHDSPRSVFLLRGLGWDPPVAGLENLPSAIADEYLEHVARRALTDLQPLSPNLLSWAEQKRGGLAATARHALAFTCAMRGEHARAHAFVESLKDAGSTAIRAFVALTSAEVPAARELARLAIELTRAKTSKNLRGLESPAGTWLVLLLLTDRDIASQPYAEAQLSQECRGGMTIETHALRVLQAVVRGEVGFSESQDSLVSLHADWERVFFPALVTRYCRKALVRGQVDRLREFHRAAEQAGFAWLASLFEATVSTSVKHPVLSLYDIEEPWVRTLRALEVASALGAEAAETAREERLVWNFALASDGRFELTARVQSRRQNAWSSGRQMPWKQLAATGPDSTLVTDRDRKVLQYLHFERASYYGSQTVAVLDPAAATVLVGHPFVFADGNYATPLEVIAGVARIDVQENAGTLTLSIAPAALLHQPVVCQREGATRLVVYSLDEQQQRVVRVFQGNPIRLPAEARDAVKSTLSKLAARFALTSDSDIAAQQIEEVVADGRIHVRLRRRERGMSIRLCVVPLEGSSALPPAAGVARLVLHLPAEQGGRAVCVVRDRDAERSALRALYDACPTLADALGGEHDAEIEDLSSCLEILLELRACGAHVEWPEGDPLRITDERDVRHMHIQLSTAADWLRAGGDLEIDEETRLSLHELLARADAARSRFIALDDGRFAVLSDALRKRLGSLSALGSIKNDSVTLHPLWLGVGGLTDDYAELRCDAETSQLLARAREASELAPTLPNGFEVDLRPYQREGFEWLCRLAHVRAGACLADDMGLGKTIQALALLLREAPHGPSLVVAPTSVCTNWFDEARRFTPALRLRDLARADRAALIAELGPHDVLVASYGIVQQEIEQLAAKQFRCVVVDEAQAIKNASTQRARAIHQLQAEIRVALTGTPVENHLGELWSLMHFLNPGLLGTTKTFDNRFARPIARDSDPHAASTLKRLIRPFVLRRHKSDVLDDLPAKTEIALRVEPSEDERALFTTLRERALEKLNQSDAGATSQVRIQLLAELTRLRRAACHPRLVVADAGIESSKLAAFEELLRELCEGGHRALVFSQFVDYLAIVRERLDQLGVRYQYLDGSTVRVRRGPLMTGCRHSAKLRALHREVHADGESITSGMGQARGALAR